LFLGDQLSVFISLKMAEKKKKTNVHPLLDHPLNKLSRGEAIWDDKYVEAMAEGREPEGPIDWDKILKPIDVNVIKQDVEVKTYTKAIERITTYEDACEKAVCPKYHNNPFKFFDDATWTSDGEEVKYYNIKCQGTESSPCSFCSEEDNALNTPSQTPKAKRTKLVQAKGFKLDDYEGKEDTPKKISANACNWCKWDPCILEDDEVNEEGRVIIDNLNAQAQAGIDLHLNNYRFALYKMYARFLGYKGDRYFLPICVQGYVDKHFVEKGEKRTGFKPKAK